MKLLWFQGATVQWKGVFQLRNWRIGTRIYERFRFTLSSGNTLLSQISELVNKVNDCTMFEHRQFSISFQRLKSRCGMHGIYNQSPESLDYWKI
jgi:hypothetical protein